MNLQSQLTSSIPNLPNQPLDNKPVWQTVSIPTAEKPLILKIDSPRTLEACQELGLTAEYFKPRPLESFGGPNINEKVRKLRYDHYHGRMAQAAREVLRRRREIFRKNNAIHQEEILNNSKSSPRNAGMTESKNNIMSQSTGNLESLKNHAGAEVHRYKEIVNKSMENDSERLSLSGIDNLLEKEVDKYNRSKLQTQKEAKFLLEQEKNKLKIMEDMKEKEVRIQMQALRLSFKKELSERRLESMAKERADKLKEHEKKYQEQKLKDRKRLKEKFQVMLIKLQKDTELRERHKELVKMKKMEKMKKIENLKKNLEKEEIEKGMKIKMEIDQKLEEVNSKHQKINTEYKEKCIKRDERIIENIEKHQYLDEEAESERLQKFFNKMKKHEEYEELTWQKNVEDEFKRKQKALEKFLASTRNKNKTLNLQNSELIESVNRSKIKENEHKSKELLKTSQKRMETQKESLLLRHEMRRLKEKDKLENYERKRRMEQFKLQKLLEKEKKKQELRMSLQLEREVQQQARIERVIHSKAEKDRIMEKIGEVTSILDLKKINDLQDLDVVEKKKGKAILKSILMDKDCDCPYFDEPKKEEKEGGDALNQMTLTSKSIKMGGMPANSQQMMQPNSLKQSKTVKL